MSAHERLLAQNSDFPCQCATKPNPVLHIALFNVDILGAVESLKFDDIEPSRMAVRHGVANLKIISKTQLIEVKTRALDQGTRGSKAEQDLEDIRILSYEDCQG